MSEFFFYSDIAVLGCVKSDESLGRVKKIMDSQGI